MRYRVVSSKSFYIPRTSYFVPRVIPAISPNYPQAIHKRLAGPAAAAYNTPMIALRAQSDPQVTPETPVRTRAELLPPWKVLLHNDDLHAMDYVVASLMKAVPLTMAEAIRVMLEAH